MAIFYSASDGGFYDPRITPVDTANMVEIADAYHAQLMAAQNMGAEIRPDANGVPQAVFPAPLTEAEALAAERAGMVLTRLQFGLQALADGVMTAAEAEGFLGPRTVPQIGEDALLLIEDAGLRVVARMRMVGFERLERNDQLLVPVQEKLQWADARMDDFFRAGMLL